MNKPVPRKRKRKKRSQEVEEPESTTTVENAVASSIVVGILLAMIRGTHGMQGGKRLFLVVAVTLAATALVLTVNAAPHLFQFLAGSAKYRKRWLMLQLIACLAAVLISLGLYALLSSVFEKSHADAFSITLFSFIPTAITTYLGAISLMPVDFFKKETAGKKLMKFLGCRNVKSVPKMCLGSSLALAVIIAFFVWTSIKAFNNT